MWTINANVINKIFDKDYQTWRYNLEGSVSNISSIYEDKEFYSSIYKIPVKLIIYGRSDTNEIIKLRNIPDSIITNGLIYSPETGMSWMSFSPPSNIITVKMLLGSENEARIESMLNEAMRYPHLLFSTTITFHLSTEKYSHSQVSTEKFLKGVIVYANGFAETGLVVHRP